MTEMPRGRDSAPAFESGPGAPSYEVRTRIVSECRSSNWTFVRPRNISGYCPKLFLAGLASDYFLPRIGRKVSLTELWHGSSNSACRNTNLVDGTITVRCRTCIEFRAKTCSAWSLIITFVVGYVGHWSVLLAAQSSCAHFLRRSANGQFSERKLLQRTGIE